MLSPAKHLLYLPENEQSRSFAEFILSEKQIPRGVYPEPLRFTQGRSRAEGERARNDERRAQDDVARLVFQQPVKVRRASR